MRKKELNTNTLLAGEPYLSPYRNIRPVRLLEVDRVWMPSREANLCFTPTKGQQQSRSTYYSGRNAGRICITLPNNPTTPYTEGELKILRDVKVPTFHRDPDRAAQELANFRDLHDDLHVALVNTSRIRATWNDYVVARRAEEERTEQAILAAQREEAFTRSIWEPVKNALLDHGITHYTTDSRAENYRDPGAIHYHDTEAVTTVTLPVRQLVSLLLCDAPITNHLEELQQARAALIARAQGEAQ